MNFTKYFSKQARRPSGAFGRFYMSRVFDEGNAELNTLVYETLFPHKDDRLFEIGFGTGKLIHEIAPCLDNGSIEGIDLSQTMVSMALRRNRKYIKKRKLILHCGDFDQMNYCSCLFDKVFSVNTIYFWENPENTIAKIGEILKPGGKLIIGFHDRNEMEKMSVDDDYFRYYTTDDVSKLLSDNVFYKDIEIISRKGKGKTCYCAIATRQLYND